MLAFWRPRSMWGIAPAIAIPGPRFVSVGKKLISQSLTLQRPSTFPNITRPHETGQDISTSFDLDDPKQITIAIDLSFNDVKVVRYFYFLIRRK